MYDTYLKKIKTNLTRKKSTQIKQALQIFLSFINHSWNPKGKVVT